MPKINKIYYISSFSRETDTPSRYCSLAGSSVSLYLIDCLSKLSSCPLVVLNNAPIRKQTGFFDEMDFCDGSTAYVYRPCFNYSWLCKSPNRFNSGKWVKKYLQKHANSNDLVIAYHSLDYTDELIRLKRRLHFRLIIQDEEIFANSVPHISLKEKNRELGSLKNADGFIFASEVLRDAVLLGSKADNCILYGSYAVSPTPLTKFQDGKIHLVYSGTFDQLKKGADNAIRAMAFLNSSFILHILGSGDSNRLRALCKETLGDRSSSVIFEGSLVGKTYLSFLSKCDVGLCTQDSQNAFNETSFPSKILSYLSAGLPIVCCQSASILRSSLRSVLYLYEGDDPKDIAQKILDCSRELSNSSRKETLQKLDESFCQDLSSLVCKVMN